MPVWYWEKKDLVRNSPSAKDGIDWEAESKLRVEGVRLIFDVGSRMKLPYETWATGAVYFHRFYVFRSFKQYDRRVVAAACLFLAGKVEETPKKGKDLLRVVREIMTEVKPDEDFSVFGDDSKETLITMERIVLKTIQFDLQVEHPYSFLLKLLKEFKGTTESKAPIAQTAWTFVNDSFCTTLCLQWEPDIIAAAMLYLSTKMNKTFVIELSNPPIGFDGKWWKIFVPDLCQSVIEDVCHQQLDFISGVHGVSKKKKKKSSSSASSTPGPGPSAPAQSDKRKATAPPSTPQELTSKKMKPDDSTPSFPTPSPCPPPPSAPPPPPPPPPPSSSGGVSTISTIPTISTSHRKPRSAHSPDRDYHSDKHSNFEGLPIPALGSNGVVGNSGGGNSTSSLPPQNYPAFSGGNDSRSPSPPPSSHPPLNRSTSSYQRRDKEVPRDHRLPAEVVRDHRLPAQPAQPARRGSSRERDRDRDRDRGTSSSSFQNNNGARHSRFTDKVGSNANGSSSGSGNTGSSTRPNQTRLPSQPQTPQQAIKPLLPQSEPPAGFRNNNGDVQGQNSATSMFHVSYAAAAAFGAVQQQQQQQRPTPKSPTPFENLVAAVLPRTPMGQFGGANPMMGQIPMPHMGVPPPMLNRPMFSSPTFAGGPNVGPPNGLTRTPSGGMRPQFQGLPPSLLPPRL